MNLKVGIFLSALLITSSVNALNLDLLEDEPKEKKVKLNKKTYKVKYFSVNENVRKRYFKINNLVLEGDYLTAKEEATKFYNDVNDITNENNMDKYVASIALGNVYRVRGEVYKWKYMQISTLEFFLRGKQAIHRLKIDDYVFGLLDLGDIMIQKLGPDGTLSKMKELKSYILTYRDIFPPSLLKEAFMKLEIIRAKAYFKKKSLKYIMMSLNEASRKLGDLYTSYSLENAHLLYLKSLSYYEFSKKQEIVFVNLKSSFKIAKKILKKRGKLDKSVFIADLYYFMGNILSQGTKQSDCVDYFLKAKEIYIKNKMYDNVLETEYQLINVYKFLKERSNSKKEIDFALSFAREYFGEYSPEYANILISKADTLNESRDYKKALEIINKAKDIYIEKFGKYSKEVKLLDSTIDYIKLKSY